MPSILHKRGTRAQVTTAANNSQLAAGELYLVTDEGRPAIGLSASTAASLVVSADVERVVKLTQVAFDALSPPDANTLYLVTG